MKYVPLISHEIPKALFSRHDFVSDYPYVLCHLLLEGTKHYDKEYAEFYKEKLKDHKFSVLDNSLFELGDSIDYKKLYKYGEEYKPSHLILPDCLHNAEITKERALTYLKEFKSTPKLIGVVQGKNYKEIEDMVKFFCNLPEVDIIAIPFDIMKTSIPEDLSEEEKKVWRVGIVKNYVIPNLTNKKKLHLLGCATVFEFEMYTEKELKHIYSVDTSAPIMYGIEGIDFNDCTVKTPKPNAKLAESLDTVLDTEQIGFITKNIHYFRNIF